MHRPAPKTVVVVANVPGSAYQFRKHIISKMVALGHKVYVCASAKNRMAATYGGDPISGLKSLGAEFVDIDIDRSGANPLNDFRTVLSFLRFFKRVRPDVVFTSTPKPTIYATKAAGMAKVPVVCSLISGIGFGIREEGHRTRLIGRVVQSLYRWGLKSSTVTVFQNPDDKQLFYDLGLIDSKQRIEVVNGSGVDTGFFQPEPLPSGNAVFLLIARLLHDKGIREYVEAARIVRQTDGSARFLLVGPIEDHPLAVTQSEIQQYQEEGIIEYLGVQSDVRPAIRSANVYVLPSYREGTPKTVLEAMAMGRPIITTDVPGCRQTLEPNVNGLLVPAKDPAATAAAMLELIRDPEQRERMGTESRRIAVERYSADMVSLEMLRFMGLA